MSFRLETADWGTAELAYGRVGDPISNGKAPGGISVDTANPRTPREAEMSVELDPGGAWHPQSGPLFWLAALVAGWAVLNYRVRSR